jgi:hypothetical protein
MQYKTCNLERSRSALSGYSVDFRMNKFSDISNVIKCGIRRKIPLGNESLVRLLNFKSRINGVTFGEGFKSLINLSQLQLLPCDIRELKNDTFINFRYLPIKTMFLR